MKIQLTLALRYLSGRKLRTTLTTLAILFGVMIFGLNGLIPAVEGSFRQSLMAAAGQVDLTISSETRNLFSETLVDTVRRTPGVAAASGSIVRPIVVPDAAAPKDKTGQPVSSFMLAGLDPASVAQVRPLALAGGRAFQPGEGQAILISEALAERTGLKIGDSLHLPSASGSRDFTIIGLVKARPGATTEMLYVPLTEAQALLAQLGQVNTIDALFTPGSDGDAVRQAVLANLGSGFTPGGNETGSELLAVIEMGGSVFSMFGALALAMGGFIIFITFRTVVWERRRDIGMLRALGAKRRTILGLFLTESLLQGIVGTAAGLAAGYLLVVGLLAAMGPLWEDLMNFPLGQPSFSLQMILLAVCLGVGVTLLAGVLPALSASRVVPLEALRPALGEATWASAGRRNWAGLGLILIAVLALFSGSLGLVSLGALLFVTGLVLVGPALVRPIADHFGRLLALAFAREGRLARENLARQPGRPPRLSP